VGDSRGDKHESVLGRVPGVVLQANYIESLLDDRYFFGLGPIGGPVATAVCLIAIVIIFDRSTTVKTAAVLATVFWLALLVVTYLLFMNYALLLTSWVPTMFAIISAMVAKFRK
jgi:CHASE2 domain-containing sensor protein